MLARATWGYVQKLDTLHGIGVVWDVMPPANGGRVVLVHTGDRIISMAMSDTAEVIIERADLAGALQSILTSFPGSVVADHGSELMIGSSRGRKRRR